MVLLGLITWKPGVAWDFARCPEFAHHSRASVLSEHHGTVTGCLIRLAWLRITQGFLRTLGKPFEVVSLPFRHNSITPSRA